MEAFNKWITAGPNLTHPYQTSQGTLEGENNEIFHIFCALLIKISFTGLLFHQLVSLRQQVGTASQSISTLHSTMVEEEALVPAVLVMGLLAGN